MDSPVLDVAAWPWTSRDFDTGATMAKAVDLLAAAEERRVRADYDTGSILPTEAYALWRLVDAVRARVVIEVGTFIGTSTVAMSSGRFVEAVYTCDASNDCLPSSGVIRTYPKQASGQMLRDLASKGVSADLCFFDGVLTMSDVDLLMRVTHPRTVYAVHDYNYGPKVRKSGRVDVVPRKGVGNVRLLSPRLPAHDLVDPFEGSTLALLLPREWR